MASVPPEEKFPATSTPPRLWPGWSIWSIVALAVAALLYVRAADPANDDAIVNILTLVFGFIAVATLFAWFVLASSYPRVARWGSVALVVCCIGVFFVFNKIDRVTGGLIPEFRSRFAPPRDATLAKPEVVKDTSGVDLVPEGPEDFPQFLGPQRNAALTGVLLERNWNEKPPRQLWRQPIGAGWSAFSTRNGFAVTQEQRGEEELVSCYEIQTGKLRWVHSELGRHQTVLGGAGPRSTPTIHGGRVYAVTSLGMLLCLDGANGKPIWSVNLVEKFGSTRETDASLVSWGRAGSPLIVDDRVVVAAGGPANKPVSLAAFEQETGKLAWQGGTTQISYASPTLATISGVRQILSVNESNATGHDPATGAVLWTVDFPGSSAANATASQPVAVGNDRVLLSKGYSVGGRLLQLSQDTGGNFSTSIVWENPRVLKTKFTNVGIRGDYAYDLSDGLLECVLLETGERVWKGKRYGQGQILVVGDVLLVMTENAGEVVMVEASPDGFTELGSFAAIKGQTWNNLCLSGKYLLVRNSEEAACYELALRTAAAAESAKE